MTWTTYTNELGEPDIRGTSGGVIVADEEHGLGARITLERLGDVDSFAVTCGIYGWMMHTRYVARLDLAQQDFAAMRDEMDTLLAMIPLRTDLEADRKIDLASQAMSDFVDRFP